MGTSSSIMKEQDLAEFRKLNPNSATDLELPTPPQERKLTDKKGFVIAGLLVLVLVPFLIYALVKSDIRRLDHGVDSCGNLCGVQNSKVSGLECSGQDFTNKPYEQVNITSGERKCTDECPPGYQQTNRSCYGGSPFDDNPMEEINLWAESFKTWWKFLIISLITTILCIVTLFLFRFCPGVIVWTMIALSVLLAVALTALFWFAYSKESADDSKQGYLAAALISTFFTLIIVIILITLVKKIKLIIQLFQETTKALFAMPLLTLLPVATLLLHLFALALMVVTTTLMITAGDFYLNDKKHHVLKSNGAIHFALIFNVIVTIWALQFFMGCQYMVMAGSVAQWFFKKNQVSNPISISFTNTMRFHLGTIALGSFIITLVAVIKALIKSLVSNTKCRWLVECLCSNIEAFLKFLSQNAYVETAIHGQSFFRSGKRAASLLLKNAVSVLALNSVGDFVLAMTQFLLIAAGTGIAYGLFAKEDHWALPVVLSFILNLIIVTTVFNVFETVIDTLFVCFCEDMSINDGTTRPYCMSKELMQFVETSKQVYKKK